ncbi:MULTISPECIES: alpha/beta fold hydrolase [Sphingomonas]|uniref:alpha/beta fold hydrolase n=1 Tax=Sphingomonas TaxID=13687 RepID=UPI000B10C47D|nr:alpha/beta fold hydrolase [Sphingomonas sp. CCH10-B3]
MSDWSWVPPADSGIRVRMQPAGGIDFELAELDAADGGTDRLALCLHGFPELNFSWRYQMPLLSALGWRVWAPNMRGYGASSRPDGIEAYRLDTLAADVAALIDASGAREVMLVAHDWGAIVAWHFAIKRLRPLARLVIMNVPHPMVTRRERSNWRQMAMSWYVFFFQLPWLPEFGLRQSGARRIAGAFTGMAIDKARFPTEVTDVYRAAALRPGALTAMVNYYRALLKTPDYADIGDGRVETPTLMIWGEEDKALGIWCTEGVEQWVPKLTLHRLPGVSHWVQQEAPEAVNKLLGDWLAQPLPA